MDEKLKNLAKGRSGKTLIEVLEAVQAKIADIRTPLTVKEHENEIRLGVIQILEEQLISKLKIYSNDINPTNPNDFV